ALKLRKWHDLIMIHDKLINTIRKQPIKTVLFTSQFRTSGASFGIIKHSLAKCEGKICGFIFY
ncbi:hypothetical protein, partial [Lactiplantibacillus pentosus]|uniref:hypothetical protein n=1 Tax=Lactiplantibacillus pentosus TaxID=1589 RepID=UPI003F53DCB6